MRHQQLTNVILNYFAGFSTKDIEKVSRHFGETVTLQDWSIYRSGKEDVMDVIKEEIFEKVDKIDIFPRSIYFSQENNSTAIAACQIDIVINGEPPIQVIDLIEVVENGVGYQITRIDAYKR
jgi:hypothetical protein